MSMFGALDTAVTGVALGRTMLDVIGNNIANANTVRAAGQAPFRASLVVAQTLPGTEGVAVDRHGRAGRGARTSSTTRRTRSPTPPATSPGPRSTSPRR